MRDRFFKLSNGDLVNIYVVTKAHPTFDDKQNVTELVITLHQHDCTYKGADAASLYAALTEDASSPAPVSTPAPATNQTTS